MRKIIALLICAVFLFTGCQSATKLSDSEVEKLRSMDGVMILIRQSDGGEHSMAEDYCTGISYTLYFNGKIEKSAGYNISGTVTETKDISDKDYKKLYEQCSDILKNDLLADFKGDGADTGRITVNFTDINGESHQLYSGIDATNVYLDRIRDTISSYFTKKK